MLPRALGASIGLQVPSWDLSDAMDRGGRYRSDLQLQQTKEGVGAALGDPDGTFSARSYGPGKLLLPTARSLLRAGPPVALCGPGSAVAVLHAWQYLAVCIVGSRYV